MNKAKLLNSKVGVVAAVGVVGALGVWYAKNQAIKAAGVVGDAINPVNDNNIFASGVNAVGAKISGNKHWSLGSWIYDITHDSEGA